MSFGVSLVVGHIVQGSWSPLWSSPPRESDAWVLAAVIVGPSAVLQTAGPHLRKSIRRVGRWLVPLAGFAAIALDAAPSATVAGLLVASIGADVVHLTFGSPQGRPGLADVSLALASLGVKADSLGVAERQPAGVFVVDAVGAHGENLAVKIYGRDAYDTQLLVTAWRSVWYREAGSPVAYGRRQQVEREAFLTLLAAQEGVLTEPVVAAGVTADDDAILVLRRVGRPLSELPDPWPERLVAEIWETVGRLHRAGISHGELDDKQLVIDGDRVGVINFRGGDSGRDQEDIRTDEAQVLVTTALSVGPQAAVRRALDALGSDGLARLLPFVQEPALTTRQRQRIRKAGLELDDLRSQAAEVSGIELPELRRMRRVSVGTLVQTGLLVLAFFALASEFAGLDVADLVDQLRTASWVLVFLGFVIGQLPRLSQAVSTLGAAPIPLPLGTVYALQLAQSYIGLAVPSSAGRVALNVRFFQRHGLSPGAALAIGAIDGFAGLVIQATLLIGLLLLTSVSLDLDLDDAEPGGLVRLVVIVLALSVVALIVLAIVPRWRRAILAWLGGAIRDAIDAVRGIQIPPPHRPAPRRKSWSRDPVRALAGNHGGGIWLSRRVRRAAADQHGRLAAVRPASDSWWHRRCRGRPDARARRCGCAGRGGVRRRHGVPVGDVLPTADLGLLRLALARASRGNLAREGVRIPRHGLERHDLLTEREQGERHHLPAGNAERDADDRDAQQQTGQQMRQRQLPPHHDQPDDVADQRPDSGVAAEDGRTPERPDDKARPVETTRSRTGS